MSIDKGQYRLLVVDGFPMMRRIVRNLFEEPGFSSVDEAEDDAADLAKVKKDRFNFVIPDWSVPSMDGLQVLQNICGDANPVISKMPMLIMTAEAKKENIITATQVGANDYVVKPFTATTLDERLDRIFEKLEKEAR